MLNIAAHGVRSPARAEGITSWQGRWNSRNSCARRAAHGHARPRFVRWCLDCGYGADPYPPVLGKRARRRAEREQTRALRMYESLRTARDLRPTSASGAAVTVLATIVHVVGFALLVLPIWLVVATGWAPWADLVLFVGVLSFLSVRPRLPWRLPSRAPDRTATGRRSSTTLLDRCATELGGGTPSGSRSARGSTRPPAGPGPPQSPEDRHAAVDDPVRARADSAARLRTRPPGQRRYHAQPGRVSAERSLAEWTKLLSPGQSAVRTPPGASPGAEWDSAPRRRPDSRRCSCRSSWPCASPRSTSSPAAGC